MTHSEVLAPRCVIVTGAGRGLGRAYALALGKTGTAVLVNDADGEAAEDTAAKVRAAGGQAVADDTRVGDAAAAEQIITRAVQAFGDVGALIHNAGITRDRTIANLTDDDIELVLSVHLRGALYLSRAVWPLMKHNSYGRIVLVSSASGSFGNVGQAAYAAAKAGVVGVARTLAFEGERYGILVNAVAPLAQTDMAGDLFGPDFQRLETDHVAPLVTLLASDECPTTGRLFTAGGGRIAIQAVAESRGSWLPAGFGATDVAAALDEIVDLRDCRLPTTLHEEIQMHTPPVAVTSSPEPAR